MVKEVELPQSPARGRTRIELPKLDPKEEKIFARALQALNDAKIRYVIGGAFACNFHTGIWRYTKDLDVFLQLADVRNAISVLSKSGYDTEVTNRYWLAKAKYDSCLIDLIFAMGNGQFEIDDAILEQTHHTEIFGIPVKVLSLEELIASKVFIAKRDRFDGADILHLIHSAQGEINWRRILDRLGDDQELLLWYLILFDYVYPGRPEYLPQDLMCGLFEESG